MNDKTREAIEALFGKAKEVHTVDINLADPLCLKKIAQSDIPFEVKQEIILKVYPKVIIEQAPRLLAPLVVIMHGRDPSVHVNHPIDVLNDQSAEVIKRLEGLKECAFCRLAHAQIDGVSLAEKFILTPNNLEKQMFEEGFFKEEILSPFFDMIQCEVVVTLGLKRLPESHPMHQFCLMLYHFINFDCEAHHARVDQEEFRDAMDAPRITPEQEEEQRKFDLLLSSCSETIN